jgi:hypothetical protein
MSEAQSISVESPSADSVRPTEPLKIKRVAKRGRTWELPRSFRTYFEDPKKQMLGAAPKIVIRSNDPDAPEYMLKYAQKHGDRETCTEFFLNQLGTTLGFAMAHSGLVVSNGKRAFVTTIFTGPEETLRHGSLIIVDYYKDADEDALERLRPREEQEFYSIDFVVSHLRAFCKTDFEDVFPKFIEMLIFDALIGSRDRHAQNWGVLGKIVEPPTYRFSPIFDTARALLWSLDESKVRRLLLDDKLLDNHLIRARPCLGPERTHPKVNRCNHFEFVENLFELYPHQTQSALKKIPADIQEISSRLLRKFPFNIAFSGDRKRLMAKILTLRADRLRQISSEKEVP